MGEGGIIVGVVGWNSSGEEGGEGGNVYDWRD